MKLDAHVHTAFSGKSTIYPFHKFLDESYSSPENVYRRAKAQGMDLVAITDHDSIDGALEIANRPDVIIGCEVTAVFAESGLKVHLGVLGITEAQHREIQKLRHDTRDLMPYLKQQGIFTILNHVASRVAGRITAEHIAALIPWIDGIEVLNGARLASQNRTAMALAEACGKVCVAGSDSHTLNRIGRTYLISDRASTRGEFLEELRSGRVRCAGRHGNYLTLASDIVRVTCGFYREGLFKFVQHPLEWRNQVRVVGSALSLPLIAAPLVGAMVHLALEERFNRALLFELAAKPATRTAPEMV